MLRAVALVLALTTAGAAAADDFFQPRKTVASVDWQAAAGGADPAEFFAKLNGAFTQSFPGIARSGVPVLLPVDATAALQATADGNTTTKVAGGFRPSKFFLAGPAGYQATFFISPDAVAGVRYPRTIEIEIAGAALAYELDGPRNSEEETTPRGFDDVPGLRRILREAHVRYAFERFGVPYVISIECFNGKISPRRLACRDADLVATRFLRSLQIAGGTPAAKREPAAVDLTRPDTVSQIFTYYPAGTLIPNSGYRYNDGRADRTVYARIRFPIAEGPAYAKSQSFSSWGDCYRKGRVGRTGTKGAEYRCRLNEKQLVFDEDAEENFSYPWRDNFCEIRDTQVGQCPAGYGHQGQDLRPSSCVLRDRFSDRCLPYQHGVVAVRDGLVWRNTPSDVIYETVWIVADPDHDFVRFRYMHMNPRMMDADGLVSGRRVREGDLIGKVGDYYKKEHGTSYHLHFDVQVFTRDGWVWVNPYSTLIAAYERLIGGRGTEVAETEKIAPPPAVEKPEAPASKVAASKGGKNKKSNRKSAKAKAGGAKSTAAKSAKGKSAKSKLTIITLGKAKPSKGGKKRR